MPVPSEITDLSTTASSNSPSGSDAIGNTLDDYLRGIQAILRTETLNKSWERWNDTPTRTGNTTFTVVGDLTSRYAAGRRIKCIDSSTLYGTIASSVFGAVTTVTVTLDSGNLSASLSEVQLGLNVEALSQFTATTALAALLIEDAINNGTTSKAPSSNAVYDALALKANLTTNTFSGAQIGGVTALTSSSNSIAINLATNNNFSHTFTENTTLANPSNAVAGQSGCIAFTQHASSAKTLAFGNQWIEASTGTAPSVSTTTSSQNLLSYYVFDSTHIYYTLNKHGVS